eukprot:TRINITY_DN17253_c0_g1_i1.p2 TRINITY_DN17253_c0_g1~~TRINITY_DN17253_c0_g1_i1.p2  ORF type:complete len:142 (-),score=26.21 TRINITY_DN17253_c0_g1_i1:776-1201(-)
MPPPQNGNPSFYAPQANRAPAVGQNLASGGGVDTGGKIGELAPGPSGSSAGGWGIGLGELREADEQGGHPSLGVPLEDDAIEQERETIAEIGETKKRGVTWPDSLGQSLTEVREFEPSESGESEDEDSEAETAQSCSCVIS